MAYEITKDHPTPEHETWRVYPFDKMEVGESFDVPLTGMLALNRMPIAQNRVRSAAQMHGKAHGKKFVVRKIDDTTARCWRIA